MNAFRSFGFLALGLATLVGCTKTPDAKQETPKAVSGPGKGIVEDNSDVYKRYQERSSNLCTNKYVLNVRTLATKRLPSSHPQI